MNRKSKLEGHLIIFEARNRFIGVTAIVLLGQGLVCCRYDSFFSESTLSLSQLNCWHAANVPAVEDLCVRISISALSITKVLFVNNYACLWETLFKKSSESHFSQWVANIAHFHQVVARRKEVGWGKVSKHVKNIPKKEHKSLYGTHVIILLDRLTRSFLFRIRDTNFHN